MKKRSVNETFFVSAFEWLDSLKFVLPMILGTFGCHSDFDQDPQHFIGATY
jgi:hypothetical protein